MTGCLSWNLIAGTVALMLVAVPRAAAQGLEVIPRVFNHVEMGRLTQFLCRTDLTNFLFSPPAGWSYAAKPFDRSLVLLSENGSASLTIKLVEGEKNKTPDLKLETLRQQIRDRFPAAKIILEFTRPTCSGTAQVFNLELASASKMSMITQLAFLPFNGGLAEFNLTLPRANFEKQRRTLAYVLQSFSLEPNDARR